VSKGKSLTDKERAIYESYPEAGGRLLARIPRLELVAEMITRQTKPIGTMPARRELEEFDRLTLGSYLLKIAVEVEDAISRGMAKASLLSELSLNGYHPVLIKAVEDMEFVSAARNCRTIPSHNLLPGMTLDADVLGENGLLLMAKEQWLSDTLIEYLKRRLEFAGAEQMVKVRVPAEQLAAIDGLFGRG
jgi:hypothetical protein